MQGQQPTQAPTWSGRGVPASVRKPPAKRSRPPARRPPDLNSKKKFIPPKDLAKHLSVKYGVRVEYGHSFPYYSTEIYTALSPLTQTAGYIDIRPYKGYIDVGYPSEEQAEWASKIPISYKGIKLPTTRTQHYSQTLLVIRFSKLPTHLPFDILRQELMEGLMKYGSSPELIFDVLVGISHLSGPCAFGTIAIHDNIKPADIPTWSTVLSAKEDLFLAQFEGARKACSKCKAMDHSKATCPNLNPFLHSTATPLAP
ncbi:hypothetical protein DSO57_1029935, partial [Entomophthora muscae]